MILTADDVKQHLRIEDDEEDDYIESLIRQAQAVAEDFGRTAFGDDAPEPVRLALLLMVSHYYENRDNPDRTIYVTMRMAFENLLYYAPGVSGGLRQLYFYAPSGILL